MDNKNKPDIKKSALILQHSPEGIIAVQGNHVVSRAQFIQHVTELAGRLPDKAYAINLCQNRYHFMVAFAAVILARQVNLLPANQTDSEISSLADEHQDSYVLLDCEMPELKTEQLYVGINHDDALNASEQTVPEIPDDQLVAMVFTSGSTGQSKGNLKYWGELSAGTALLANRFGFDNDDVYTIVATVVPQHMFGLETSVLLPMLTSTCVHIDRPFYPADVERCLSETPRPRVLVTTPVHLRAIRHASIDWPKTGFILSATAPLSRELAVEIESVLNTEVREIFGCTEAGSFASRTTVRDDDWMLYDDFNLKIDDAGSELFAPHLGQRIHLFDIMEFTRPGYFRVTGRHADMLNIAGKRASLGDLNHKLMKIDGVNDGVFYMPDFDSSDSVARLAAFVVAPEVSDTDIIAAMSACVDAVFLPRPIIRLEQLPYNDIGKLPRQALTDLYVKYKQK